MNRKKILVAAFLAVCSTSALALAARTQTGASFLRLTEVGIWSQPKPTTQTGGSMPIKEKNQSGLPANPSGKTVAEIKTDQTTTNNNNIPTHVTYLFLFTQLDAFEQRAVEAESRGEDSSSYRTLYKRIANLTDAQADLLIRTAIDCSAQLKGKDQIAKELSASLRAQYQPDMTRGEAPAPPPPPSELVALQKEREQIIMLHRDIIKSGFGNDFDRFEAFIQSHITSNIKAALRDRAAAPASNVNVFSQSGVSDSNGKTRRQSPPKQDNAKNQALSQKNDSKGGTK